MRSSNFRVTDNQRRNRLNYKITNDKKTNKLPYAEYSFLKIVSNAFDLQQDTISHITFILLRLRNDYRSLCGGVTMENIVLSATLYVADVENELIDISCFTKWLYKPEQQEKQLTQIYSLYQTLQSLFHDSDTEILPHLPNLNHYTVTCIV